MPCGKGETRIYMYFVLHNIWFYDTWVLWDGFDTAILLGKDCRLSVIGIEKGFKDSSTSADHLFDTPH